MGVLNKRIKKYNKYVIEIENEEIETNNFENIENVIIISKKDFENELQKSKELNAKLHSRDLELKLKELKLQEKDIEIQKSKSLIEELEETHKLELNVLEKKYINETDELKKIEEKLENKVKFLQNELEEAGKLQNQMEVYRIGNIGLKNDITSKEEEISSLKSKYKQMSDLKAKLEMEIKTLQLNVHKLSGVQVEYDKLINNYRHLQEVANKKDRTISELEAKKRKLDQYLSMSLEAITTLKNLGLFNRLFKRVPEGIDELQEDIKKLQPPKEIEIDSSIEIEPVRAKKTTDILGEKE
jgi:chromosome segregation ATPase